MQNSDVSLDFSSIKKLEKIVQLSLPITFISNEKAGIVEVLDSWIRQHSNQLEGILVGYSNVSLISLRNTVISDKLYILVNVKANFDLFCPNVGDIAKGKINRISKEHIGCLLHDTINVVIRLTEYYPEELNKFIRLDHDILFEITHFDCKPKEIRVKGKITPHCLGLMNDLFPVVEEEYITNMSFTNQNVTRYDFDDIFASHQSDNINSTSIANHGIKSETATKCDVNGVNQESSTMNGANDLSSLGSDTSSMKLKEKKSKKRKRDDSNVIDTSLSTEKKSKKRKRHSNDVINTTVIPKKHKTESTSDEHQSFLTGTTEMRVDMSPQKKKFKSHKIDSSLSNDTHKKKKKDKKNRKAKKKDHTSSKRNKIVASGSVLKADKKHKKKHLKKEGNKKNKLKKHEKKSKIKSEK